MTDLEARARAAKLWPPFRADQGLGFEDLKLAEPKPPSKPRKTKRIKALEEFTRKGVRHGPQSATRSKK